MKSILGLVALLGGIILVLSVKENKAAPVRSIPKLFRKDILVDSGQTSAAHRERVELRFVRTKNSNGNKRRSRRSSGEQVGAFEIELKRPSLNSTLTLEIALEPELISSDFELYLNGYEVENHPRRAVRSVGRSGFHGRTYSGTVFTENGLVSGSVNLASTGRNSSSPNSQFMGLVTIDGIHYSLEPSEKPVDIKGNDDYYLEAIKPEENRHCGSRNFYRTSPPIHLIEENQEEEHIAGIEAQKRLVVNNANVNNNNVKAKPQVGKWVKSTGRVLELAIFTDVQFFEKMKKKFPKNTLQSSVTYVLALVNNMNILYKDPSIGQGNELEIRLNYLEVLTKNPQRLNVARGRESVYLPSFCNFAAAKNTDRTRWDHAMMLTGTDLRDGNSKGVLGVAWTGTLCDNKYSCSLVEASSFAGTYTMAHELGHGLGINHDGEENNLHCDPGKYLMAAYEGAGQLKWSTCSQNNLRDYLNGKSSIQDATNPKCLKTSFKRANKKPIDYRKEKLPGEIYNAAQQCAMALGNKLAKPIIKNGVSSICNELKCGTSTRAVAIHPALEGTGCGPQKWCRKGSCVAKPK